MADSSAISKKFVKKSHIEHILSRPDTYIGSTGLVSETQWVLSEGKDQMEQASVTFSPGLYKIYDEILNNAIDQSVIDTSLENIKVSVEDDGSISVYNDGKGLPVVVHDEHGVYIPELIFGHLLTSTNYDDTEERVVGGRNGYGAKLTNIFSKQFTVEVNDALSGKLYVQTFRNNLEVIEPPVIRKGKQGKGYVRITFTPDYERFSMEGMTPDMMRLMERRVWDAAACCRSGVSIYWQKKKIGVKNFERYVDAFLGDRKVPRVYEKVNDRWEVAVAASVDGFKHVSFVNGIATYKGGSHVNYVTQQVIDKLKNANAKKAGGVKASDIRERLWVFIRSTLVNPTFTSQTKEECASKVATWGSKVDISDEFIKKVAKLGVLDSAVEESVARDMAKTDGKKRSTLRIPKLEDANKAGTAESSLCTLILTEGDSAKTFAISGMAVVGRDYWGVFPLKGKLLNVRDASSKQVIENAEISNIKQILGLQHGKEYNDTSTLRYGRVMVMTDADVDGNHIKGLVLNMFHCYWPSLIKLGYVCTMCTPIVKAFPSSKSAEPLMFYNLGDYSEWKREANTDRFKIKYYKGLGTSTPQEAREYFKSIGDKTVKYVSADDDVSNKTMDLAFKKILANERKHWIQECIARTECCPVEGSVDIARFINTDLVQFSIADVVRSLPSMCDGLKPSQRKVVYGCLKRSITSEIKVSQLASAIGEMTSYHHGDASLCATIVNMAQVYMGSNNVNLLRPVGQFGTRLQGGKDCASPRYINTCLETYTFKIFDDRDSKLLKYLDDDGTLIEPQYFVPILPMVLINGAEGIGTGYSTYIPPYNPIDVIANIRRYLMDGDMQDMSPWFRGFKGEVVKTGDSAYQLTGAAHVAESTARNTIVHVTELPVGYWTQDFKEYIESERSPVETYDNYSTETRVHFVLKIPADKAGAVKEDPIKALGLSRNIYTSNMHLFDEFGCIRKYDSPLDILRAFCAVRLQYYGMRKAHLLQCYADDIKDLKDKRRFIELVLTDVLVVFRRPTPDVLADMAAHELPAALIKTPVSDFTQDKLDDLDGKIAALEKSMQILDASEPRDLWMQDLYDLEGSMAQVTTAMAEQAETDTYSPSAGKGKRPKKK